MSDRRLRELERRFAEEGTPQAEQALLRVRVQVGDLSSDWLRVAAHLGHPAARKALGGFVRVATLDDLDVSLDGWGAEAQLRAAVCLLESRADAALAPGADGDILHPVGPLVAAVLSAAASPALAAEAEAVLSALEARWPGLTAPWPDGPAHAWAARCLLRAICGRAAPELHDLLRPQLDGASKRETAKALRVALVPWALKGRGTPPAGLLPNAPVPVEALQTGVDEAHAALRARLQTKEVLRQATALRRRRREKRLALDALRLAACMGDPAAWLVAKPDEPPALVAKLAVNPQRQGAQLALQLSSLLLRFAKKLPRDEQRRLTYLRRLHDPQATASDLKPVWPDWSRPLVARLALVVGDELVLRFAAHDPDPRPRLALVVAHAFHRDPLGGDPHAVQAAAREASNCARRKLPDPAKAAAQGASWAAQVVARIYTRARVPTLQGARFDLLDRALAAGFSPQELWDLLRRATIAWALDHEAASPGAEGRAYRPGDAYAVGELLEHPRFGLGRVLAASGRRLDVEFEGVTRSLIQGG